MIELGGKRKLRFSNGHTVPKKLKRDFLVMQNKVGKTGNSHVLVEVDGKVYSVPIGSAEMSIANLVRQMGGKFHGGIICLR